MWKKFTDGLDQEVAHNQEKTDEKWCLKNIIVGVLAIGESVLQHENRGVATTRLMELDQQLSSSLVADYD